MKQILTKEIGDELDNMINCLIAETAKDATVMVRIEMAEGVSLEKIREHLEVLELTQDGSSFNYLYNNKLMAVAEVALVDTEFKLYTKLGKYADEWYKACNLYIDYMLQNYS